LDVYDDEKKTCGAGKNMAFRIHREQRRPSRPEHGNLRAA
jgi:hypothetical protein